MNPELDVNRKYEVRACLSDVESRGHLGEGRMGNGAKGSRTSWMVAREHQMGLCRLRLDSTCHGNSRNAMLGASFGRRLIRPGVEQDIQTDDRHGDSQRVDGGRGSRQRRSDSLRPRRVGQAREAIRRCSSRHRCLSMGHRDGRAVLEHTNPKLGSAGTKLPSNQDRSKGLPKACSGGALLADRVFGSVAAADGERTKVDANASLP